MPPKKNEPVAPPPEDPLPFGIFVSLSITSAQLKLELAPPANPEELPKPPKTHLSISIPGSNAPVTSDPVECSEDGQYRYQYTRHFRRPEGMEGLLLMINGRVTVSVVESETSVALATGQLDVLGGFALGKSIWIGNDVALAAASEGLPASVVKVGSASLNELRVSLGQRTAPEGTDPNAPLPEGSALPELTTYSFVPAEEAAGCNMVELAISGVSAIPVNLQAVADSTQGKLTISAGMSTGGVNIVLAGGVVSGDTVSWSGARRQYIPPAAVQALRYQLEDGLPMTLEVARYAGVDGVADPAWESYHAAAPLPAHVTQALLQPGATAASTTLPALRAFGSVAGELPHVATCLPGYTAPAGKVKPIEDAPADGSNAWAAAEAVIALSLKFSRPIMPPWTPPPKPARSLTELIPPRDLTPKPPPVTATDAFRNQVQGVVKSLALEYTQSIGGSVGTAAGPEGSVEAQAARQKALVFELNRSGKYLELKDSLKAAVVSIVQEKYRKSGSMSPNELASLYSDLYTHLMDHMHAALHDVTEATPKPQPPAVPNTQELSVLSSLAAQAEVSGDLTRAQALHQRRVLAANDPSVWADYGAYWLRRGGAELARAEECYREVLALEAGHLGAVEGLLATTLQRGRAESALPLEAAEAAAHALHALHSDQGLPIPAYAWALMALVYHAQGESKHIEAAACEQELGRLDREACEAFSHAQAAASASGNAFLPSRSALAAANGYLAAAAKLLELGLPQLAADALEHVPTLRQSAALPAVVAESTQLRVRALAGLGEWASVQAALKPMLRGTDVSPGSLIAAQTLSARAGYAQGNADVAIREYQTLLNHILNTAGQQGLSEVDLSDFLNLAKCYESRGDNAHALDVYTLAAAAQPGAAVLWRCAGRCQVELGELQAADLSLSEANVLDPEEPSAWGLLALVALRCGRQEDARKALKCALRFGLSDGALLEQLASEYSAQGAAREASGLLDAALRTGADSARMRLALAKSQMELGQPSAAQEHVRAALDMLAESAAAGGEGGGAEERMQAEDLAAQLDSMLMLE